MRIGKLVWATLFAALTAATAGAIFLFRGGSDAQASAPPPAGTETAEAPTTAPATATATATAAAPVPSPAANPVQNISTAAPAVSLDPVKALIASGDHHAARAEMSRIYFAEDTPPSVRTELEPMMLLVSRALVTDRPTDRDFEFYKVGPGDSLIKIAERFRVEKKYRFVQYGVLKLFNRLSNDMIRVGQTLRVPKGEVALVVRMSQFKLYVFHEGIAFASYPVALGAEANATPAGLYVVGEKTAKPTWWPPESTGLKGPIAPDDPKNPLGTHWIALQHTLHSALGIHGTNDPGSIGTRASLGCVRMRNEDVKVVFECVTPGMQVHILE
jgi:lipoprotein-anchoring transpeptidase ErfK/SrfK